MPQVEHLDAVLPGVVAHDVCVVVVDLEIEVWEITNPNSPPHPFHVHGNSFQILSRGGTPPPAHELGWKDVALVRPFETVRIIKVFRDYADSVNPYMFHCHMLEHEDVGMMGQFVVE